MINLRINAITVPYIKLINVEQIVKVIRKMGMM